MNITLTGASGFLGKRLIAQLLSEGHTLHLAGRRAPADLASSMAFSQWPSTSSAFPQEALRAADAVIHLTGEPVAQRWSEEVKGRIRSSRVEGTQKLVEAMADSGRRPAALVCASATGFYGDRGDEILTEESRSGAGFLADVCVAWERAADAARDLGVRVVKIRTGIVLGPGGGALEKILPPFRAGAGGKLGSGKQWMSWIHLDDIADLFTFAARNDSVQGALNGTAPEPVRNEDFTHELAHTLHRPAIFPVPKIALRVLFGEMADVLLSSSRAVPQAVEAAGFRFRFPSLSRALEGLFGQEG